MTRGSDAWRAASARRLLARLALRTRRNEGVGILQAWHICARQQARDELAEHGRAEQDTEAQRMIAVVDATANGRADPDARWD